MQLQDCNWQIHLVFKNNQQSEPCSNALEELPAASNLEVRQCSTTQTQISYEPVPTGVRVKHKSLQ